MNVITKIDQAVLEAEAIFEKLPQVELQVDHHFSKGLYARRLFIPKGLALTGKIHKHPQLNILAMGEMNVVIDGKVHNFKAGAVINSPAGVKRLVYSLEDSIWITIHGTEETDLEIIERQFIAQDEKEYLEFIGADQLRLAGI